MKKLRKHGLVAVSLLFSVLISIPGSAMAQTWNFDSCNVYESNEVQVSPPAAYLMLDRSGSMNTYSPKYCCWKECSWFGSNCKEQCGYNAGKCGKENESLWDIAVKSLKQAVLAMQSRMYFGLSYFTTGSGGGPAIITLATEAIPNAYTTIANSLDATFANGGTPTAEAIAAIRTSETMNREGLAAAGVLITDGKPRGGENETKGRRDAIQEACKLRDDAQQTLYVVGLSQMTDTAFNNKLAAAGGTGSCTGGDPCENPNVAESTCTGSIQADNQKEFQAALSKITDEVACTFPVNTSLYLDGDSPDDPEALRVRVFGAEDDTLPFAGEDGEGWYYPNPRNRNQIALTKTYCDKVANGHIEIVETKLACPCSEEPGTECPIDNAPAGVCPVGSFHCEKGYDVCRPLEPEFCPVPCPGWEWSDDEDILCHRELDPENSTPEEQELAVSEELTRCNIGVARCVDNVPVCAPKFRPMPEICNGLDNDCDGKVGNITESWSKDWSQEWGVDDWTEIVGPGGHTPGANACYGEDLCRCRVSIGQHEPLDESGLTLKEEFEAYMDNHVPGDDDGGCICVEN